MMDTPSHEATLAKSEGGDGNALRENGAQAEPEMLDIVEQARLATVSVSNTQTTVGNTEVTTPISSFLDSSSSGEKEEVKKESATAQSKEGEFTDDSLVKTAQTITVQHHDGEAFLLPWALCQTRKGLEDLVKFSYRDNEAAKKEIDDGEYELLSKSGAKIFPHLWDVLAEPGCNVTIRLNSQKDPDAKPSSDPNKSSESEEAAENLETLYTAKVKYTVAYYPRGGPLKMLQNGRWLYSKSYDEPVVLEKSGDKAGEIHILEEIKAILIPPNPPPPRGYEPRESREPRMEAPDIPKLNAGDMPGWTTLQIHSPLLLNALRSIVKYVSSDVTGAKTDSCNDGKFMYPYKDLFHHKQELSEYKKTTTGPRANHTAEYNAECDRHIDFLLEFLDKEPGVRLGLMEANWAKKTPTTTFAGFWLLMKPGSDVYVKEDGQLNAYVVEAAYGGVDYLSKFDWSITTEAYSILVWNLTFDGKVITRESKIIRVPMFDNEKDILSLPLFPTRFQDKIDGGARRKELIDRGRKMFRFSKGPTYLEYSGSGLKPGWKKYNQARVIVVHEPQPWDDRRSNQKDNASNSDSSDDDDDIGQRARAPRCECTACKDIDATTEKYISETFSDYDNIDPKDVNELSEHQYLICMSHMSGFILKDRVYDILDISRLVEVNIVKDAIDRLVMRPETNKDAIKAIVKTYTESSQAGHFNADFIRGKGEGQIFLLHGPPGTGKTLTAESVAEYTRRPLLSITAADLGHEPIKLEQNLLRFFKDATEWDAIVLLDEADVYLERRSAHDLRRNSIVSIFLRAMDYFQGILFLTSNRVGHFDEAFMSRIHVSIGYERLDDDARSKIWDNLFSKLKEDHKNGGAEIRYEYDAKQYVKKDPEIKKLQWNGREIRNAFQTAVALAVFDAKMAKERGAPDEETIPEIKEKHLSQVVSMSSAFKEYITATHEGIEDSDMAFKLGIRHDKLGAT
ncbi:hypothetical protein F5Y10DRAFT_253232 [Nemania abortiva]|nr:hypothetical protein F5Y10DRAFT_253232 [Nemania abortiva]